MSFTSEQGTPTLLLEKHNQGGTELFQTFRFTVKLVITNKLRITPDIAL
jgi:hypothetical protein